MSWFVGGHRITKVGWLSPTAVYVDFVSEYTTNWLWQLYANRKLIGRTVSGTVRRIVGQLSESHIPAPLTLVRVDPGNVLTDYGSLLPKVAWSRFNVSFEAETDPDLDTDRFEITGSLTAGGAVNADNLLVTEPFIGTGTYQVMLPPLTGSGVWSYAITPRDDALPVGNAGTATEFEIDAVVMPRDLVMDSSGNRFSLSAASGVVTASFVWP